ncbi:hypothetical protein JCM21900_001432 [Sporobolomyces salmonicolor]
MHLLPLHTAHISTELELAYIDSWSDRAKADLPKRYLTIVGLHGVGFNSAIWNPLIPSLPSDVRFLAYNQRSYTGSSPAFPAKAPGGTDATAQYLVDLMEFVNWAVEQLELPKVEGEGQGGVVLLSWSKGTVLPISLLSLLHQTPSPSAPTSDNTYLAHLPLSGLPHTSLLSSHLRALLLFEPPGSAFGRPATKDYHDAMSSVSPPNSSTAEEFAAAFAGWIGGYSPLPSAAAAEATAELAPTLAPSHLEAFDPDLVAAGWQPLCVAHGFAWTLAAAAPAIQALGKQALAPGLSPAVPVGLLYGARTNGYFSETAGMIEAWWGVRGAGERMRKTASRRIDATNHFAFVHRPQEFARAMMELVQELDA